MGAIRMTAAPPIPSRLIGALKVVAHHQVISHDVGKDYKAVHIVWSAYSSGEWCLEVRKSGELLLRTKNHQEAAERFTEELALPAPENPLENCWGCKTYK